MYIGLYDSFKNRALFLLIYFTDWKFLEEYHEGIHKPRGRQGGRGQYGTWRRARLLDESGKCILFIL